MFINPNDDTNSMKDVWWFKVKFEYETGDSDKQGRPKTKKEEVLVQGDSVEHVSQITLATMMQDGFDGMRIVNASRTNILEAIGKAMLPAKMTRKPASLMSNEDLENIVTDF